MLKEKCSISKPHSCSHLLTQQYLLSIWYTGSWLRIEATVNSLPPGSVGVGMWSNADFLMADTGKVYVWVCELLLYWNTSHLLGNMFWYSSKVSPRLPDALVHPPGMMLGSSGNPVKTWNQSRSILGTLQFLGWGLHLMASDSDWQFIQYCDCPPCTQINNLDQ